MLTKLKTKEHFQPLYVLPLPPFGIYVYLRNGKSFFKQVYLFRDEENEPSCALLIGVPTHCLFTSRRAEAVFGNWFLNCRCQSWAAFQCINNKEWPVLRSCAYDNINTTKYRRLLHLVTFFLFLMNIRHEVFIWEAVQVVRCSMETTEIEMLRLSLVVTKESLNIGASEWQWMFDVLKMRWFGCGRRRDNE